MARLIRRKKVARKAASKPGAVKTLYFKGTYAFTTGGGKDEHTRRVRGIQSRNPILMSPPKKSTRATFKKQPLV